MTPHQLRTSRALAALGLTALLFSSLALRAHSGAPAAAGTAPDEWVLEKPQPTVAIDPHVLPDLESFSCNECHQEVVAEWAESAHGLAWVDKEYRESLEDRRRPEQCYDCHIPQNLVETGTLAKKVKPREDNLVHGISCDSCHLGPDGAYLGPWGAPTSAHASAVSDLHIGAGTDALCITCHDRNVGPVIGIAKDYKKSYAGTEGAETCVGCHMQPVERQWALPAEGEDPPPVRKGRSHLLQSPRDPNFMRMAFDLSAETTETGAVVIVKNRAGHRVPGLIGREIEFRAEVLDDAGKVRVKESIVIDKRRYLPVRGETRIELDKSGASVRVRGFHDAPRAAKPVEFVDVTLPLGG